MIGMAILAPRLLGIYYKNEKVNILMENAVTSIKPVPGVLKLDMPELP